MAFGLLGPIDVTFPHDFMMLVLSCHVYAFRLYYSYCFAFYCFLRCDVLRWAMCHCPLYFLLAVTLIVYLPSGWHQYSILWILEINKRDRVKELNG